MQSPTLVELASYLKLDKATVSRALNGKPGVAAQTRERVLQAAKELGYIPNIHGQQLRTRQSNTLALVLYQVTEFSPRFYGPLVLAIFPAVTSRGFDLIVVDSARYQSENIAHLLVQKGAAGAMLKGGPFPAETLDALQESSIPIIQLDVYSEEHSELSYVASENFQAVYEMTRYLIDLGHRRLACAGIPTRLSCFRERYQGFQKALTDFGLEEIGISIPRRENHESMLLSCTPRPTAIVSLSDSYAERVLIAAREAGLEVPGDLSVTGFDDVDQAFVEAVSLTTVHADLRGMTEAAVDFLLNQPQATQKRAELRIRAELILRGSTAPPPVDK